MRDKENMISPSPKIPAAIGIILPRHKTLFLDARYIALVNAPIPEA